MATLGRRIGPFAGRVVGTTLRDALPEDQAELATECMARALRSGEAQQLDLVVWEGDQRHVLEGRLVATDDDQALLILLDATERRALTAASEAIVAVSHALLAPEPLERVCNEVASVLATRLGYPAARVSLRHPTVQGASVYGEHGDMARYGNALLAAARAAHDAVDIATVGTASGVPVGADPDIVGSIS
ncbi:MAG: PAS domain-containing protein [Candidatus Poribacteria bacterium]